MDRVLEIGGSAAGYGGRLFAHTGHDVLRIEPHQPAPGFVSEPAQAAFLHSNKRRIGGATTERIQNLANSADIIIMEADTTDALAAMGFDTWAAPVKVAITPFGRTGPKRNWAATPNTLLAMGGYTQIIGDAGREPLTLPGDYLAYQAGQYAYTVANACRLAGLTRTIELSQLETLMSLSQFTTALWHCAGSIRERHGNDYWSVVPTNLFASADGWVYPNITTDFWDAFTVFIDRPELLLDERFTTNDLRMANREPLHQIIADQLGQWSNAEIRRRATEARIPLGVVQTFDDILADEHLAGRDFWQSVTDVKGNTLRAPRLPFWVDGETTKPVHLNPVEEVGDWAANVTNSTPAAATTPEPSWPQGPRTGPLAGIRILDLTHVWAGPLGVRILSDLGADVVKVESATVRGPRTGNYTPIGGWIGGEPGDEPWNNNAVYIKLARNRRSLCLDLKSEQGRETFLELVKVADVVIENFSARTMPSLGLDYAALHQANPRLLYVTMPGYGSHGPYHQWVAFGPTVEVMSGLTNMLGYGPEEPRNSAMAVVDPVAALSAASAISHGLRQRQQIGKGARIELSLHEAGVSFNGAWLVARQLGESLGQIGNLHPGMAPYGVFPAAGKDQWLALGCRDDGDWRQLALVIDAPLEQHDWPLAKRQQQGVELHARIAAWTAKHEKHQAAEKLQAAGIPAGAVNTAVDMVADPQVIERQFFVPLERDMPVPGTPWHFQDLHRDQWTPCPRLGEHNGEVLKEWLSLSDAEIAALKDAGLLADAPPA